MHAYAEILDPSVVSHALFVTLGPSAETCLVLVRGGSLLQVYRDIYNPSGPTWLAEFPLDGTVTQINTTDGSNIVVSFRAAKLVVLDWDQKTLTFMTRSLHYYEKLLESCEFGTSARDKPILTVDPEKRSMVFRFQRDLAALVTVREFANPLFSELQQASNHELKSSELRLMDLVPHEECAEIVDIVLLPIYTVPTVAVLYWNEPNWEGLVPKFGDRTKELAVVSMQEGASSKAVISVGEIPIDVFKIVPVRMQGSLILLIGSSSLNYIDEAGVRVNIPLKGDEARLRFENCQAAQLPDTDWVIIALESGALLAVDMRSHSIGHLKPAGFAPEPTCLAMGGRNHFVVGSRLSECSLCRVEVEPATTPKINTTDFSLKSLYNMFVGQVTKPPTILGLKSLFSFPNIGAMTAVAPIDDGIACSSGNNVVIVERELPLIEFDRVQPPVDLNAGRFWVLNDAKKNSKLLLVSSKTLDELERENESDSEPEDKEVHRKNNKRRRTKQAREFTVFYDELLTGTKESAQPNLRRRPKQIRAFATDQATLAVHEGSVVVVVVQTRSLSLYETGTWKFLSATPIPTAYFAEIQNDHIVTQHREGDETRVYSAADLELLNTVTGAEYASICRSFLLTSFKSWISIYDPRSSEKKKSYDLTRLSRVLEPSEETGTDGLDLVSIFALEYSGIHYIGVHLNRLFSIYELIGDVLLKRFTVPFMVNQSPIWLASAQALVFTGPQSHVVVKGRASGFACHPLQTDGLYSVDFTSCSDLMSDRRKNEKASPSFTWLDDRQRLHFCYIDPGVEYKSNKLPYRRIPIEPGITIQDLAYHDDTQSVVIGANRAIDYNEPAAPEEDVEMKDAGEENTNAGVEEQVDTEDREEPHAQSFTGCVFILPLANYEPFEVSDVNFEQYESIMSLECVDHCDAGGRQLVAIGTAKVTYEDSQCNGHIYLYRVEEPSEAEGENDEKDELEKPSLHFFAKDYLRGAVSSISEVMGFLAVAHGQQIRVYNFHKELEPVGFFDTEVYMKDMKSVRNLLLLGEELRGPRLVNFGLQPHRMDLLSSSDVPNTKQVPAALTSIEGVSSAYKGDLCLVSCDANGRLQVLEYDPENPESAGGTRFVPLASFYTGRYCSNFAAVELANENLIAYGVTQEGVLFSVAPIPEEMFRTLFVLTQQMMDKEHPVAGMNPRGHRQMLATPSNHEHRLIDFNYAQRLWSLPLDRQIMYSRKLGFNGLTRAHRTLNSGGRDSLKL